MLPASRAHTSSRHGVRACFWAASWASDSKSPSPQSRRAKPSTTKPGRQQAPVGQVVDGREQLLAGQVAGDAEDHQRARLRDPRQPAVLRVAQRVHRRSVRVSHGRRLTAQVAGRVEQLGDAGRRGRSGAAAAAGGPRPASACRSPAAWAACSSPKVYGLPGTGRSSATAPVIWRNDADLRPALVVLAGGVQEPRPPAEGDRPAAGAAASSGRSRRPRRRRRTGPGRPSPRGSRRRPIPSSSQRSAPARRRWRRCAPYTSIAPSANDGVSAGQARRRGSGWCSP